MMRSIRLNENLRSIANSAIIAFLGAIAIALDLLPSLRSLMEPLFKRVGISNDTVADIVLAIIVGLFLFILSFIINLVIERQHKQLLIAYHGSLATIISSGSSGDRIRDFQLLRSQAHDSILVMGIGMTYFSTDRSYLKALLDKGLSIRLLMINPDIIVQNISSCKTKYSIVIEQKLFDSVFIRPGYTTDVRTSFERLCQFIEDRKSDKVRKGRIELRTYPYLILMNVTMIDEHIEKRDGQMLIEVCPPFSDNRMRIRVSESSDKKMFHILLRAVEELWGKSDVITSDDT